MKKIISAILVITMLLVLVGCGSLNKESHKLQFSWSEAEGNVISAGFKLMADTVKEKTDGKVTIDIFYNGSLMTHDAEFNGIKSGDLDMTRRDPGELATYCPEIALFSAPYVFVSWEHCVDTITGEIGDQMLEVLNSKVDFKCLGFYSLGARIMNTTVEKPIKTPEDLKGVLLRVPAGEGWVHMGNSLGATATPLALTETYTALQTGVVQAQDNPLPGTYSNKFYEVAKQISLTNHVYSIGIICISNKAWNALSEDQQKALEEAVDVGVAKCHEDVAKQTEEMLTFYKENGVNVVEPDIAAFQDYSHKYYEDNGLTKDWPKDIYDAINASATKYLGN